jgi:hypothetical protein
MLMILLVDLVGDLVTDRSGELIERFKASLEHDE